MTSVVFVSENWLRRASFLVSRNLVGNMIDDVSDMLTRIRNAQMVKKPTVILPCTNLIWSVAKFLEKEGYAKNPQKRGRKIKKSIELEILYDENGDPVINGMQRVSRPGRRVYEKSANVRPVKRGLGISVVSTSKGLMSNDEAKKSGVGGELLFKIW